MVKLLNVHINDKERLKEAMDALEPGEFIEVQGNGGPMTIGVPSLENESEVESGELPQRPQGSPDSWLS